MRRAAALLLAAAACDRAPRRADAVAAPVVAAAVGAGACAGYTAPADVGKLALSEITEASGLVASRKNDGVFFVHNDSGDRPRIFAVTRAGHHLGTFDLAGAKAFDWEDIAAGPAPNRPGEFLYVADTGDNHRIRSSVTIYRVPEPVVLAAQAPVNATLAAVEAFELRYPDGAHDAETLLVDPDTADVVIVTKERDGPSLVFRVPPLEAAGAPITLTRAGTLTFANSSLSGRLATSGDVTPAGDGVAVRTYVDLWLYPRAPGTKLWEALAKTPCALPLAVEKQGESIAFVRGDGGGYVTLSEGSGATLHFAARK